MESETQKEEKKKNFEPITWKCDEYKHTEKNNEWYWALGLIGVAGSFASLMFENVLFAIFILIAVFVLALFAQRKPDRVVFTLTQRGLRINDTLHLFKTMKSFGIEEFSERHTPKLIFESSKIFKPDIIIPLEGVEVNAVHDFLFDFLPEDEHEEPVTHKFMEWLGF